MDSTITDKKSERIRLSVSFQYFFQIFIPLFVLILIIFAIVYWSNIKTELRLIKTQEHVTVSLQNEQFSFELNSLIKQLAFIADDWLIDRYLSSDGTLYSSELEHALLDFSKSSLNYDQIRLLDLEGNEIIRINFNNGKPVVVPENELQNKKHRRYFKELSYMPANSIYISALDLNIEHKKIEKPYKPVIRFGKTIINNTGEKKGHIILNYLAWQLLKSFSELSDTSPGENMLLNDKGYWLKSDNPEKEWGFMFNNPKQTFGHAYTREWDKISAEDNGQFLTQNGLFTFATCKLFKTEEYNSINFIQDERYWKIVSFVPNHVINARKKEILYTFTPLIVFLTFLITIGSWFLANNMLQKKSREKQLQKLSLAVEQIPVTVVITNTKGDIEYANPTFEKSTGYTRDEVIGKNSRILKAGTMPEGHYQNLWETLTEGDVWKGEFHNKKKNGDLFWEATTISPIRDKKGFVTHYLAVKEDITKRKEMEEELRRINDELEMKVDQRTAELQEINSSLEQEIIKHKKTEKKLKEKQEALKRSNKDLEEFAYIASHDLNEPLRKISSFGKLLENHLKNKLDDDTETYLNFILNAAERMRTLINELLKYSRVRIRDKKLTMVDTNYIVSNALSNLELMIFESKAEINKGELPKIKGDETQLLQLFQNLISNALKYRNSKAPHVEIGAQKEKNNWRFYVRDNGIGIDPKYAEKIFLIFQRLHARSEYSGTGIGLAVCKKIIEQHGGRIWVESQPGSGSTFYFTLKAE